MTSTTYDQNAITNPLRPVDPAEAVPWKDRSVTIFWMEKGVLQQTHTVAGKREALAQVKGRLMAAWTGRYKTDLIAVDRSALRKALG